HMLERHRHGGIITRHDVAGRVADQENIDACLVQNPGHRIIISSKHAYLLSLPLHFNDGLGCYFCRSVGCCLRTHDHSSLGTIAEVASSSHTTSPSTVAVPSIVVKLRRRLVRKTSIISWSPGTTVFRNLALLMLVKTIKLLSGSSI